MPQQISPRELAIQLANGRRVILLDVRQPVENQWAALPNSTLIPLQELPQRVAEIQVEPGTGLIVYCHHGIRSLSAAAFLENLGYFDVKSLAGGIDAWSREVDPTVPRY